MIDKILKPYKIVLASASPRRREILNMLNVDCVVKISDVAEPMSNEDPILQTMRHARNKLLAVTSKCDEKDLVIAADTIVVLDDTILGKPQSKLEAASHLRKLSGNSHQVITALCIGKENHLRTVYEISKVRFASLSDAEIKDYLDTNEPMDKAGAYGIQGYGSQFITSIEGCYFNVMGFPVRKFYETLTEMIAEGTI